MSLQLETWIWVNFIAITMMDSYLGIDSVINGVVLDFTHDFSTG